MGAARMTYEKSEDGKNHNKQAKEVQQAQLHSGRPTPRVAAPTGEAMEELPNDTTYTYNYTPSTTPWGQ